MGDPFIQNLIPVLIIGLIAIFARVVHGTWLAPGTFLSLYWLFAIIIPMSVAPWYPVWSSGLWVICLLVIAFFVGSLPFAIARSGVFVNARPLSISNEYRMKKVDSEIHQAFLQRRLIFVIFVLSLIGFAGLLPLIGSISSSSIYSVSISELAFTASQLRYHGDFNVPLFTRLAWACTYTAGLLSGILIGIKPGKRIIAIVVVPVLVSAAYTMILTTKANLLIEIILVISGFVATLVSIHGRRVVVMKLRTYIVGAICLSVLMFLLAMSQGLRYGYQLNMTASQREVLIDKFSAYVAGHLSAFTGWVEANEFSAELSYGARTFAGLADALGLTGRVQGVYEADGLHSTVVSSNVFTAWRGLLEDFGLFGAAIAAFSAGFVLQYLFHRLTIRRAGAIVIVSAFYSFVMWSFVISLFQYNTTTICFLMAWFFLVICSMPRVLRLSTL